MLNRRKPKFSFRTALSIDIARRATELVSDRLDDVSLGMKSAGFSVDRINAALARLAGGSNATRLWGGPLK